MLYSGRSIVYFSLSDVPSRISGSAPNPSGKGRAASRGPIHAGVMRSHFNFQYVTYHWVPMRPNNLVFYTFGPANDSGLPCRLFSYRLRLVPPQGTHVNKGPLHSSALRTQKPDPYLRAL